MQEKHVCWIHGETQHFVRRGYKPLCVRCRRETGMRLHKAEEISPEERRRDARRYAAKWRRKNAEKLRARQQNWYGSLRGRTYQLLKAAQARAMKSGALFTLNLDAMQRLVGEAVAAGRVTLDANHPESASLDRINCREGYRPENVQVVPAWYNFAKNKFDEAELRQAIFRWVREQEDFQ